MKINIALITLSAIFCISCSQKHQFEATISNLGNDTILVTNYFFTNKTGKVPVLDTIFSQNGKFAYSPNFTEPVFTVFSPTKGKFKFLDNGIYLPKEKSIFVLIEPKDNINVTGNLEKYTLNYTSEGSEFNEVFTKFRQQETQEREKTVLNEIEMDSAFFRGENNAVIESFFAKRRALRDKGRKRKLVYIKENTDKDVSAFFLTRQDIDTLGKYYNILHKNVRNGIFKNILNINYNNFQKYTKVREVKNNIKKGGTAPNFTLKTINGNSFELKQHLKDKYIVLDFWGSWCAPCISGFPKMKDYYKKYNNQLEIIGIACNDKEEDWKSAVQKHNLEWTNLINEDNIEKNVSVAYAVDGYPTKIIINPSGIIEGVFDGEGDDFYNALDNLFKK